jgi:hypothetical protein
MKLAARQIEGKRPILRKKRKTADNILVLGPNQRFPQMRVCSPGCWNPLSRCCRCFRTRSFGRRARQAGIVERTFFRECLTRGLHQALMAPPITDSVSRTANGRPRAALRMHVAASELRLIEKLLTATPQLSGTVAEVHFSRVARHRMLSVAGDTSWPVGIFHVLDRHAALSAISTTVPKRDRQRVSPGIVPRPLIGTGGGSLSLGKPPEGSSKPLVVLKSRGKEVKDPKCAYDTGLNLVSDSSFAGVSLTAGWGRLAQR